VIPSTIRRVEPWDFEAWLPLWNDYNAQARSLYEQVAQPTAFVVYER
jgi:hypothetical protein